MVQADQRHPIHAMLQKLPQHRILTVQIEPMAGNQQGETSVIHSI
jgi:hypothetical protein